MADVQHVDITDPDIHEPKGAAAASGDTVYVADGAGSGTWQQITLSQISATAQSDLLQDVEDGILDGTISSLDAEVFVNAEIPDISTLDTILVPIPVNATLIQAHVVLQGAITVADAVVTFTDASDNSMGTGITVAFTGSAAGDSYTFTPTANNALTGPTYMKVKTDGGSTTAQKLFVTLHFYVTRTLP